MSNYLKLFETNAEFVEAFNNGEDFKFPNVTVIGYESYDGLDVENVYYSSDSTELSSIINNIQSNSSGYNNYGNYGY